LSLPETFGRSRSIPFAFSSLRMFASASVMAGDYKLAHSRLVNQQCNLFPSWLGCRSR
jgi:hypothetical protein